MRKPVRFSPKQRQVLSWWRRAETKHLDAIICDGAVRSGKTTALALGFTVWACSTYAGQAFAICGKTVTAVRRNLVVPLCKMLTPLGFGVKEYASRGFLDITFRGCVNRFYLFGGRDEGSAQLIQGVTLAGVLLDEVVLMPRSFVEQAIARCSVPGSRLWFSCNPGSPAHWFYREWIRMAEQKHALYLHFTMSDNAALTPAIRARYERLYQGAFYDRYVKGIWCAAEGLIYPMFSPETDTADPPADPECYVISCDYGTLNPTSAGLWGKCGKVWYRIAETYYDARREGRPRTDEEHYEALRALAGNREIGAVILDPSAASLAACIRRHGEFPVIPAENAVLPGIQRTADALQRHEIVISPCCKDAIREFALYRWDEKAGRDQPVKENDHAMDDIRYFAATWLDRDADAGFFVSSVTRHEEQEG